jgi:hypothetical protein
VKISKKGSSSERRKIFGTGIDKDRKMVYNKYRSKSAEWDTQEGNYWKKSPKNPFETSMIRHRPRFEKRSLTF